MLTPRHEGEKHNYDCEPLSVNERFVDETL
jgi:hypothetical protein